MFWFSCSFLFEHASSFCHCCAASPFFFGHAFPLTAALLSLGQSLNQPRHKPSPLGSNPVHRRGGSISSLTSNTSRRVGALDNNVMASTAERSRLRRERTFVGSECAVCEEPLEHTLQGERILQFSCSHVSHEACFYEFIREFESQYCPTCNSPLHLDTSRGGNVIDISSSSRHADMTGLGTNSEADKIGNIVRTAGSDTRSVHTSTPTWDSQTMRAPSVDSAQRRQMPQTPSIGRGSSMRESRDTPASERFSHSRHGRSDSEVTGLTGVTSSNGYPETTQSGPQWRHDYDVQAMEASPGSPRAMTRKPIPPPSVTVRSEFPTINRSRQQQTLTCLITIEVPDNNWKPDPEDIGSPIQQQQQPQPPLPINTRLDDLARSPVQNTSRFYPYEAADVLEEMTESLRSRVDNWHGLDFSRLVERKNYLFQLTCVNVA